MFQAGRCEGSVVPNHQLALWFFLVQGDKRDRFEYDALFCHRVIEYRDI